MAFIEMDFASGGGSDGIPPFRVTNLITQDNTSKEWDVPSDTDFVLVLGYAYESQTAGRNITVAQEKDVIGVVRKVGESITVNYVQRSGGTIQNVVQTLIWQTPNKIKLQRGSTDGMTVLLACKYL